MVAGCKPEMAGPGMVVLFISTHRGFACLWLYLYYFIFLFLLVVQNIHVFLFKTFNTCGVQFECENNKLITS